MQFYREFNDPKKVNIFKQLYNNFLFNYPTKPSFFLPRVTQKGQDVASSVIANWIFSRIGIEREAWCEFLDHWSLVYREMERGTSTPKTPSTNSEFENKASNEMQG